MDKAIITQAMGQGLTLRYQHLLPQQGYNTSAQGERNTSEIIDLRFSAGNVAAVMSYSGIEDPEDCRTIWTIFANKEKNVESCRWYLMKGMQDYGYRLKISMDNGIYLEQDTMQSILDLHFNLGEGVAHLQLAANGLSILCCRAWASHETEEIKEQELVLNAT